MNTWIAQVLHFDNFAIFIDTFVVNASEFEDILIVESSCAGVGGRCVEGRYSCAVSGLDVEDFALAGNVSLCLRKTTNDVDIVVCIADGVR